MIPKTTLLAAASALVLSAGAAAAAPATAESALNMRAGPGTQYEVVTTIPGGATVDVAGCTGSWCQVSYAGEAGFASRSYLAMAEGPPVVVAPGYAYDDTPLYGDDYYDYGPTYGPGFGLYVNPGHRLHRGVRAWNGGRWSGGHRNGHAGHNASVTPQPGFAGPPASWQRPGTGIGVARAAHGRIAGAPAGMRTGGPIGGGARVGRGAPRAGAQAGFAGSIVKH